jgi:hypothetical protein
MSRAIYSFPELKEPEKTSAWRAEERPQFVDHDLEEAKRRTALIKEKMSPPGALGLPPRLEEARLKYGITDGAFKSQASFDRIFVFPIDAFEGEEAEKTTGGIFKPELTKLKDKQEGHRGVLISAGLTAMDRLMSHGYELGDIVTSNKNVPFARRCDLISNIPMFYLVMRDGDLAGNESLMERIRSGQQKVIDVGDQFEYQHQIASNDNGEWTTKKKASVYITDAW